MDLALYMVVMPKNQTNANCHHQDHQGALKKLDSLTLSCHTNLGTLLVSLQYDAEYVYAQFS